MVALSGCHSSPTRGSIASAEPGLVSPAAPGSTVVEATPARAVTFVDRHPLFYKPREYYDTTTGSNKVVKAAAATVIGVPAGIFGELKQIVVGAPAEVHY
jgi:hypothetical protein